MHVKEEIYSIDRFKLGIICLLLECKQYKMELFDHRFNMLMYVLASKNEAVRFSLILCICGMAGLIVFKVEVNQYQAYLFALRVFSIRGLAVLIVAFFILMEVFWLFALTIYFAGFFFISATR